MPTYGRRYGLPTAVIALFLTACGGDSTGTGGDGGPLVETSRAVTETVGVEGGSVSATSSTGVTYRLDVPAGALAQATQITLTPIRGLDGGPLSDGFVGAVQFGPSGLRFRIPAVLRIGAAPALSGGRRLVGFGSANDGSALGLDLARSDGGAVLLDVIHFSDAGASAATPDDVAAALLAGGSDAATAADDALARIAGVGTSAEQIAEILRRWYIDAVRPELQAADGGGAAAEDLAMSEWVLWRVKRQLAKDITPNGAALDALLATEDAEARPLAARVFRAEIRRENDRCAAQHELAPLAAASGLQEKATRFGLGSADLGLDRDTFLREACVRPEIILVTVPQPLQAGFPNSMDAQAGLRFGETGEPVGEPFSFSLTAINATLGTPQGFSTSDGKYTSVITAAAQGAVQLTVGACLVLPGEVVIGSDICVSEDRTVRGVDLTGAWSGTYSQTITTESGSTNTSGNLTLQLTQNQNAISGTYQNSVSTSLSFPGQVFATLSGVDLVNFQLVQSGQCPGTFSGPATINGDGTVITASFSGTSCAGTHSNGHATITRVP